MMNDHHALASMFRTPTYMLTRSKDYALWLLPAGAESVRLKQCIQNLAGTQNHSPTFAPHVTLLHPIQIATPIPDITAKVRDAIAEAFESFNVSALPLELLSAQGGSHFYQSVLAPVRPHSTLLALRKACERQFGLPDSPEYFPHLSLLYGDLSKEERSKLATGVNNLEDSLPQVISIREIGIVKVEGVAEQWVMVGSVTF
jgi:2'-5' RNA ligase